MELPFTPCRAQVTDQMAAAVLGTAYTSRQPSAQASHLGFK